MNRSESKYFNTALRMDEALAALLEKKDFEYITVKEICDAAGVNRSTFYLHYENTRDLLDETGDMVQKRFLSYFDVGGESFIDRLPTASRDELQLITPDYLHPYLSFIRDHRRLYAAAMSRPSDFRSQEAYGAMFRYIFDPILARFSVPVGSRRFIMAFYLNGIAAVISEWLKGDCKEPLGFIADVVISCIPREGENKT